ncbi:hypothetical protein PHLGIDRAFT_125854 [Phlebiopsis gigantea 11061_1 CR5-6]|uniref:Uncharacterized protein n=1 Tax=Phlebiopsis gigantea (strain 11061_1 CR5-6) TaxID=745531 RepID=A0A0C3S3C5_PHLG1|nr:hypothetical protein PHLGIDRAFT_125854 [Phlebiopsis gigantea 11061_1 CR5-6]
MSRITYRGIGHLVLKEFFMKKAAGSVLSVEEYRVEFQAKAYQLHKLGDRWMKSAQSILDDALEARLVVPQDTVNGRRFRLSSALREIYERVQEDIGDEHVGGPFADHERMIDLAVALDKAVVAFVRQTTPAPPAVRPTTSILAPARAPTPVAWSPSPSVSVAVSEASDKRFLPGAYAQWHVDNDQDEDGDSIMSEQDSREREEEEDSEMDEEEVAQAVARASSEDDLYEDAERTPTLRHRRSLSDISDADLGDRDAPADVDDGSSFAGTIRSASDGTPVRKPSVARTAYLPTPDDTPYIGTFANDLDSEGMEISPVKRRVTHTFRIIPKAEEDADEFDGPVASGSRLPALFRPASRAASRESTPATMELREELARLREELQQTKEALDQQSALQQATAAERTLVQAQLAERQEELEQADEAHAAIRANLDTKDIDLFLAQVELQTLQAQHNQTSFDLQTSQQGWYQAQQSYVEANLHLQNLVQTHDVLQQQVVECNGRIQQLEQERNTLQTRFAVARQMLKASIDAEAELAESMRRDAQARREAFENL